MKILGKRLKTCLGIACLTLVFALAQQPAPSNQAQASMGPAGSKPVKTSVMKTEPYMQMAKLEYMTRAHKPGQIQEISRVELSKHPLFESAQPTLASLGPQ
jgi:hypothetical protein